MISYYDKVFSENRGYFLLLAKRYNKVMEPEDLVQEASIALWNFMKESGPSTAQSFDNKSVRKLARAIIRNIASDNNINKQKSFERNFAHNLEDYDIECPVPCSEKYEEFLDYMQTILEGKTRFVFNFYVNISNNNLKLTKKDICEILHIDYTTLTYHIKKIKKSAQSYLKTS